MNYRSFVNIILFFLLSLSSCKSQGIIDREKKIFFDWFLSQREEKIVSKKPATLVNGYIDYLKEEVNVSKKDSSGFINQINLNNTSLYRYEALSGKTFLEDSAIYTLSKNPAHLFLKISKPVFFNDIKRVWIYVEQHCGVLCGSGMIEVYEKTASGYKLLFVRDIWIS